MKHFLLLLITFLITATSMANDNVLITASDNASYSDGDALIVNGLSATELNIHGEISLTVYWDGTGGATTGYAATLTRNGGSLAFCDEGLMVTRKKDAIITIAGIMTGYANNTYELNVEVAPKKPSTIHLQGTITETTIDRFEPTDLVISARATEYNFSITLFNGLNKKYGEYDINSLYMEINNESATLKDSTTLLYSLNGEQAVIEAAFVCGIDTLIVKLSGAPYVAPEDILPTDTISYSLYGATVGKSSGFNTVMGKNDQIELKIQVPNGDWLKGVTHESFSYGSYLKVDGRKLTILRGNLIVTQEGDVKTATIGLLCSDHIWYNITATTAAQTNITEIELTLTNKEVQGSGRYANLVLTGKHDTYGTITIYLNEFNNTYKTYAIYYATIGNLEVTGEGTWSKNGDTETLDATVSTAQFGQEPTDQDQIFHIIATYTPEKVVTLNFEGFNKFGYDSQYGDWYMEIMGNEPGTPEYQYKLVLAYYAPANNGYGTFTSAKDEINIVDSYILTLAGAYVMFDSVALSMEKQTVSKNLQQTIAHATLLGQDGVTYLVTCTHNSITPSQQYTAQINNATLQRDEDSFTFEGDNDSYEARLTINSNTLLGKHAMKAIDLQNTKFIHNGNTLDILSIQAEVTTKTIGKDLACVAQVAFLTKDTVQYVLALVHNLPAPTETVDITCTNVIVNDDLSEYLGVVNFNASNNLYTLSGTWVESEAYEGTFTSKHNVTIELLDRSNNQKVRSLDATIHAKLDEQERWTITGTMRGENNILYNLNLTYVIPTPTDTILVRFDQSSRAEFTQDMDNYLYFDNTNDQFFASLAIHGVEMESEFTIQNVDREFCGVRDSITGLSTSLADINGRIFQVGDTTIMQAQLISMDAILYDIELWYTVPTPTDTVTLSFPVEFGDMRSEQGFYQLYGPSPDTAYVVAFSPLSEEIEGTFVNDGMFGRFGAEGGRMEMDHRNSYIVTMDGMTMTSMMAIEWGQMTVEMDENGDITAVAEVICADRKFYHITMTSHYAREYLHGDKPFGSVERTYTAADVLTIVDDYIDEGYLYLAVGAADQSDLMAMHFFTDSTDADIIIPEGTYNINKSFRPGTVLGNTGPDENNQISTPFYATTDRYGYLVDIYMWVKGTVTIAKKKGKLYLEVNAVNSYDVPVHIIYDGSTLTSIINTQRPTSKPRKYIRNGLLIINQDDTEYNIQGTIIQ